MSKLLKIKTFVRRILDVYINSSTHVALAIACISLISYFKIGRCIDFYYVLLIFFASIVGYNFLKFYHFWQQKILKNYYFFYSVFATVMAFLLWKEFLIWFGILLIFHVVLVLAYLLLRPFGWLKMFYVALVITSLTTLMPIIDATLGDVFWMKHLFWVLVAKYYLIILALLIPFEIIDAENDQLKTQTLPQILGIKSLKYFGYGLVVLFALISQVFYGLWSDIVVALTTMIFIYFSHCNRTKYYTLLWGECIPIMWLILYLIEKKYLFLS